MVDAEGVGARPGALERLPERLVVLATAVAYFATCARHVLGGDNGEFATLFAQGGVAHPPGYPLYVLWLRLLHFIPASSPAHGAALSTAILGVATVPMLQLACRAWGVRRSISALVSAIYAFSPLSWELSTSAEVFAPNALIAATILALSAPRWEPENRGLSSAGRSLSGGRRTLALGLLAGLGLSHHHTIVLLLPIGLYAAITSLRRSGARAALLGVAALVVGLTPHAYLIVASHNEGWTWGGTGTLSGFLRHVARADYGTTQLQGSGARAPLSHLVAYGRHALIDLFGLPLVALGAFVAWGAKVRVSELDPRRRNATLWLVLTALCTGPLFVMLLNARLDGLGPVIVEKFYLLGELVMCLLSALALSAALGAVKRPMLQRNEAMAAATLVAIAAGVVRTLPLVREYERPTVELYALNTLSFLPERAVVIGKGDHRFGAFLYAREALRVRRDVVFVNAAMASTPWYRGFVARELGLPLELPPLQGDPEVALDAQLLAAGRAVFVTGTPPEAVTAAYPSFPIGTVTRLLPKGDGPPDPTSLLSANEEVFAQFTLEATAPKSQQSWAGNLQLSYARPWALLAIAFSRGGDAATAKACEDRALAFVPWLGAPPSR